MVINMKASKKLVSVFCITLAMSLMFSAVCSAFAVSQADIDNLKKKQSDIAASKTQLQAQISQLDTQISSVMERKQALDEQNELAQQEIELINEQIALYDKLIEQKAKELEDAKKAEEEQKAALRVRMRAMEESGSFSYIAIVFEAADFTDLLSRLDFISSVMKYDKELENAYIAAVEHVSEVKAEYEVTQKEQEQTRAELEAKKAELEASIAEATALIAELEANIEEYRAQYEASEAQATEISAEIDKLVAALEAQQAASQGGSASITGTGSYVWPLPGYSPGSAYGWRMHPILGVMKFHAGEDIGAPSGTPIIAADSGTVILSTYNAGGYGNYVTISHGNGHVTLYGHMSSRAVAAGDTVSQGQVIGYVGSTGMSTGPHLHFEVRVNGSTTDPKSYFNFG